MIAFVFHIFDLRCSGRILQYFSNLNHDGDGDASNINYPCIFL